MISTGTHQQPHFHARYGDYRASFTIDPPALLAGAMRWRQQHLVLAWAELHQEELFANWDRAAQEAPLARIDGLARKVMNLSEPTNESQLHDVADFAIVRGYVLRVRFDDGTEQVIDFEPILSGPLLGELRDLRLFRQVRVDRDLGTLVWPTGADIDPNVLYD